MDPFFGPSRDETLAKLYASKPALPITLGDGMPSYIIDFADGRWSLAPLRLDPEAGELAAAEPIFATQSKAEFVRWLELWPWLGTGVPRAAPPTSKDVTAVTVDFEHLALPHRTKFQWARGTEARALEHVDVEIEREVGQSRETIEVPGHLWWEFLDVLHTVFSDTPIDKDDAPDEAEPPPAISTGRDPDATVEYFRIPPRLQAARAAADRPTIPGFVVDTNAFLRCRVQVSDERGAHEATLSGEKALELMSFMLEFAAEFGLPLPG